MLWIVLFAFLSNSLTIVTGNGLKDLPSDIIDHIIVPNLAFRDAIKITRFKDSIREAIKWENKIINHYLEHGNRMDYADIFRHIFARVGKKSRESDETIKHNMNYFFNHPKVIWELEDLDSYEHLDRAMVSTLLSLFYLEEENLFEELIRKYYRLFFCRPKPEIWWNSVDVESSAARGKKDLVEALLRADDRSTGAILRGADIGDQLEIFKMGVDEWVISDDLQINLLHQAGIEDIKFLHQAVEIASKANRESWMSYIREEFNSYRIGTRIEIVQNYLAHIRDSNEELDMFFKSQFWMPETMEDYLSIMSETLKEYWNRFGLVLLDPKSRFKDVELSSSLSDEKYFFKSKFWRPQNIEDYITERSEMPMEYWNRFGIILNDPVQRGAPFESYLDAAIEISSRDQSEKLKQIKVFLSAAKRQKRLNDIVKKLQKSLRRGGESWRNFYSHPEISALSVLAKRELGTAFLTKFTQTSSNDILSENELDLFFRSNPWKAESAQSLLDLMSKMDDRLLYRTGVEILTPKNEFTGQIFGSPELVIILAKRPLKTKIRNVLEKIESDYEGLVSREENVEYAASTGKKDLLQVLLKVEKRAAGPILKGADTGNQLEIFKMAVDDILDWQLSEIDIEYLHQAVTIASKENRESWISYILQKFNLIHIEQKNGIFKLYSEKIGQDLEKLKSDHEELVSRKRVRENDHEDDQEKRPKKDS